MSEANAELVTMMQAMMARLASIEARLDAVAPAQPEASLVRAVDGAVAQAASAGLDVDARAQAAVGMLEVLTRPDMVAIVDLVGRNTEVFTALLNTLAQSPGTLELLTQTIASFLSQRDEYGRTLEEQFTELVGLAKRLTNPVILGHAKTALDLFEESPDLYGVAVDYLQQLVKQIIDLEGDVPTRIECGVKLLEAATRPSVTAVAAEGLAIIHESPETVRNLVKLGGTAVQKLEASDLDLETLTTEGIEILELAAKAENLAMARRALVMVEKNPETIGTFMDIAEGMLGRIAASELDLAELSGSAWDLLELAATPDNITLARDGLALVAKLNGSTDVMMSVADELVGKINEPGFGFEERARMGIALLEQLSEPGTLAAVKQLTESGMMDPAVMQLLVRVGKALQASTSGTIKPRGMFGAFGALQSKRVQLAMGFGLDFAEQLGDALEAPLALEDKSN